MASIDSTSNPRNDTLLSQVTKDTILEGPYWPEPVRVLSAEVRNRRIEIHAMGLHTERYFSDLLDAAEFNANVQVTTHGLAPTFAANPRHLRLAVEAHRIRLAHEYDPRFTVSVSQIDPLPYQLEAVYLYVLRHLRVCFPLADELGAGGGRGPDAQRVNQGRAPWGRLLAVRYGQLQGRAAALRVAGPCRCAAA